MTRALLIIAHGSRRQAANEEFRQQVAAIASRAPHDMVEAAFLELAEPGIEDGITQLATAGATVIDVFPLFLNAGRHVSEDIPTDVDSARKRLPGVQINLLDYLGKSPDLLDLVAALVTTAAESAK